MVRLALEHLAAGAVLGGMLLAAKATGAFPALWAWRAAHLDLMLVGGMLQLALGVAHWMLPRTGLPARSTVPEAVAAALLNAGVLTSALGSAIDGSAAAGAVLAGRLAVAVAATVLVVRLVPRVRPARGHG